MLRSLSRCMKPTFTPCGKLGCRSSSGPSIPTGARSTEPTRNHDVRVAHRHRAELDRVRLELQPIAILSLRRRERERDRLEVRHAEIDAHALRRQDLRRDAAARGSRASSSSPTARREEAREAAHAVAALLDLAAVGVEDPVARVAAAPALRSRAGAAGRSRRRGGGRSSGARARASGAGRPFGHSTTMKSLPRPFILVNLISLTRNVLVGDVPSRDLGGGGHGVWCCAL